MTRARVLVFIVIAVVVVMQDVYAVEYETFIDIADDDDLYDLLESGNIAKDTFEYLLELYERGVDLNTADREELYSLPNLTFNDVDALITYRDEIGHIRDPVGLVTADVLTEAQLLAIAPFVIISEPATRQFPHGHVRYRTQWVIGDHQLPPMTLQGRVRIPLELEAGVGMVLQRTGLGTVAYDPLRDALSARAPSPHVRIPKFYVSGDGSNFRWIAGTYQIGFAERLTFDNSGHYDPDGFRPDNAIARTSHVTLKCKATTGELASAPCDGKAGDQRITPDYSWTDTLQGAAFEWRHQLDRGELALHAFGSYLAHSVSQFAIYNRNRCSDPRDDDDPGCDAPALYRRRDDVLLPTSEFSFHTLPNIVNETLGGGHIRYNLDRRTGIGVTGWGAKPFWRPEGIDLDFQEWSKFPSGGPYGAVGIDATYGKGWSDTGIEFARTFDRMPQDGGGGYGLLLRETATWNRQELETSLRWYDNDFANPYGRPIAAADEVEGNRARGEAGVRIRYAGRRGPANLRGLLDVWQQRLDTVYKMRTYLRGDVEANDRVRPGLWLEYRNDLLNAERTPGCMPATSDDSGLALNENTSCDERDVMQVTPRMRININREAWLTLQYQHEWQTDTVTRDRRQDISAYAASTWHITDHYRLRLRSRYLFEDIRANTRLEQSLHSYAAATARWGNWIVGMRYDIRLWLDERSSTQNREPSPEHWFGLDIEARF